MKHRGRAASHRLWRAPAVSPPVRLLPLFTLALLLALLAAPDTAQAADQLRFHAVSGDWAVASGVADGEVGKVKARGVPKGRIRYSVEGAGGFSIGRRSGRVSYDGTSISGEQVSLTVTARDNRGEAASASRIIEVSVAQPAPPPEPEPAPESAPEPSQPAGDGVIGQGSGDPKPEPDTVAPTVTGISTASTPAAHDSYGIGETITIQATFSEPVNVTGVPCLLIRMEHSERPAAYASGSGTNTLSFTYTVAAGDRNKTGIDYYAYSARSWRLSCQEGGAAATIRDAADNDANLNHRYFWGEEFKHMVGGPKVISERVAPTITGIEAVGSPASGDTYRDGEYIHIQVTFSEPVVVHEATQIGIWVGNDRRDANYLEGSGANKVVYRYRVMPKDRDNQGVRIISTELPVCITPIWPCIRDSADNQAELDHDPMPSQAGHKVAGSASDSTAPTVVKVTTIKPYDAVFIPGQEIGFEVIFNEGVNTTGTPRLEVTVGGNKRTAEHRRITTRKYSEDFRDSLWFYYTVTAEDANPLSIAANAITLPDGATIRDESTNDAVLTHDAAGPFPRHRIYTTYVVDGGVKITSSAADGDTYRRGETVTVSITFNKNVTVTGTPTLRLDMRPKPEGRPRPIANYSGGSGTKTITFDYVIIEDDVDDDGLEVFYRFNPMVLKDTLVLPEGASIEDEDGNDALLVNDRIPPQIGDKVDGRPQ